MYRFDNALPVEYRADSRTLTGYAAVFYRSDNPDTEYRPFENHAERIAPGTFKNAIERKDDVRAFFNHDSGQILGRLSSGTLELTEDKTGLRYDILLPDTSLGRDIRELVQRGDLTGSSFAFRPKDWSDERSGDEVVRTIRDVELVDVGPVTFPAYTATSVDIRSSEILREQMAVIHCHNGRLERIAQLAKRCGLDISR